MNYRYDRLRTLLTSKLLPRRETLLQLRRQLTNTSSDIEAARCAIERETMADAEKIIERLRNVESMKQSSIQHQVYPSIYLNLFFICNIFMFF